MKRLVWLNTYYQPVIYVYIVHECMKIFLYIEYIRHIHTHMELTDIYLVNMGIHKSVDSLYIAMWNACIHNCASPSIS